MPSCLENSRDLDQYMCKRFILHRLTEDHTSLFDFPSTLQSPVKVVARLQKWVFLMITMVSGVTELVGGVFSQDLSNGMASVA